MTIDKTCKNCGTQMEEIKKEDVANSTYHYLRCGNCKKEVARREE